MLILSGKHVGAKTTLGTTKSEGNHPKCWFSVENTLEPNYTGNHKNIKGTTQNVDFEQEVFWSQTTLGTITSEGNHPTIMIGQKCVPYLR